MRSQKKSNPELKIGKATQIALNQVIGAFAIVVFDKDSPNELVVAKLGSPLAIGLKLKDFFGSDPLLYQRNKPLSILK